jgi:peroxiredoxin
MKYLYIVLGLFTASGLSAQTISLEFPYFAGKTYEFRIVQGENQVVVRNDTVPKDGKVQFTIPDQYKDYKGVMWYLNSTTGNGLEMIINHENFSVKCLDPNPSKENIVYQNTLENVFASTNFEEQQVLFAKHDAMLYAKRAYPKTHELYPVFDKEYHLILEEYNTFAQKLKATNLYAARYREIANLSMGIGNSITDDEQLNADNTNAFMVNQLDYEILYTSNHWGGIIKGFVQLQTMVFKNDDRLLADVKTILKRINSPQVYTDFLITLTKELTTVGKDALIASLAQEIKKDKKLLHYNGVLSVYQQDRSGKAPNLEIIDYQEDPKGHHQISKTIDLSKQKNKYSLLLFHQSGCGFCEETIEGLLYYYNAIKTKGITIISLSADTDEQVFKTASSRFPWKDKYFDLQGMNGINFKNYAVIGTPTLFLIDNKGIIVHKWSGLEELKKAFGLH